MSQSREPSTENRRARMEFEDYRALAPGVLEALDAMTAAIREAGVDDALLELAKLRASQLNGCAQCAQIHINAARRLGMEIAKIDQTAVWHHSPIYDERERAVLAWTERLTDLVRREITDEDYRAIHNHFTAAEVATLTAAIAQINVYNRLGNAYHFTPPHASRREA